MKRVGNRKAILIVGLILGLAIIGYAVAAYAPAADERDEGSKDTTSDEPATRQTSFTGELVCLPHKGDPEVMTMECAFGLKDKDTDVYYALRDKDAQDIPSSLATIPVGDSITVEGVFQKGESDVYDIAGTIAVTTVKQ